MQVELGKRFPVTSPRSGKDHRSLNAIHAEIVIYSRGIQRGSNPAKVPVTVEELYLHAAPLTAISTFTDTTHVPRIARR